MITYQTNIWEKDWKYILSENYLNKLFKNCPFPFSKRIILVNNVNNRPAVELALKNIVEKKCIDNYYFVEDYYEEVLKHFSITKESFKGGYLVSISELVGIYLCKTKYLLYFKGDSYLPANHYSWIEKGISLLENRQDIFVVNACWNKQFEESKNESLKELDEFYLGQGFSDQCFLVRTADFQGNIYHETNIKSERFPVKWGNSFEKRVDSYMHNHQLYRATHKTETYFHENFKENMLLTSIGLLKSIYLHFRLNRK